MFNMQSLIITFIQCIHMNGQTDEIGVSLVSCKSDPCPFFDIVVLHVLTCYCGTC